MKLKCLIFALLSSVLLAAESQVDLRIDSDPDNLGKRSCFNVTTTNSITNQNYAFLFSPSMSFYVDGAVDFSFAFANRYQFSKCVVGHQVFFDRSYRPTLVADQLGTGIDVLTNHFDVRLNYYHPLRTKGLYKFSGSKWMDSEILFKTPYFGVGTGPLYNIDMRTWALHSRLIIPMKGFSVNIGGLCGAGAYSQLMISLSFHLFPAKNATRLTSPMCHVKKMSIYTDPSYVIEALHGKGTARSVQRFYGLETSTYVEQSEESMTLRSREDTEK